MELIFDQFEGKGYEVNMVSVCVIYLGNFWVQKIFSGNKNSWDCVMIDWDNLHLGCIVIYWVK